LLTQAKQTLHSYFPERYKVASTPMRYLFPLLFCFALLSACMDDESYTTSPADILTFSTDTVAFDTIISGTPTNTYTFTVYNRSSKAIHIPQVSLAAGAASPFKVNVDGTSLTDGVATDFEIASEDSMIVYLMANVPETDSDQPIPTSDKLIFLTEAGTAQEVVLTASAQAVNTLTGVHINNDTTLSSNRPYRIMDSIVVDAGATLTLAAGTRLYFHADANLIVQGTLRIEGTKAHPVELRGDRLGNMFAGQPYDRIPGQWGGIEIRTGSYDNYFSYANIHSGTFGVRVDSADVSRYSLTAENSIIHNTTRNGLDVRMANVYFGNSQITNAGGDCVHVRGGDITLVHCTIARFYVFTGGSGVALDFANYDGTIRLPIKQLLVANSIVTGYQEDEIMGSQNEEHTDDAYNYIFTHTLLNTPETDELKNNSRIINCIYDIDDGTTKTEDGSAMLREQNFTPLPDTNSLTFSFALSPYSKAVGTASQSITAQTYPTDPQGRSRTDAPDMGCYQHATTANP